MMSTQGYIAYVHLNGMSAFILHQAVAVLPNARNGKVIHLKQMTYKINRYSGLLFGRHCYFLPVNQGVYLAAAIKYPPAGGE
jgi:hypothetical protein